MRNAEDEQLFLLARGQVKRDRDLIRSLVRIRKTRESQGLSQKEVASRMGTDQSVVSRFENLESNPTLRTIRSYAIAIGAEIAYEVRESTTNHEVEPELMPESA